MILKNDFYSIQSLQQEGDVVNASIGLNQSHVIFAGHFPGQPVVPGVCMVQIIKEILETTIGKPLQLKAADHIKFLSMVNPQETAELQAIIKYVPGESNMNVTATLSKNETICLKMKGVFVDRSY